MVQVRQYMETNFSSFIYWTYFCLLVMITPIFDGQYITFLLPTNFAKNTKLLIGKGLGSFQPHNV